jgi:putative ABC transport system ATP-binding protein
MIRAEGVRLTYRDGGAAVRAVDGVSLEVRAGEFVGILGPSGSGKSSLLYLLAGLKIPTEGRVLFRETDTAALDADGRAALRRTHFGFVFQSPFLIPYLTALENVRAGGEGPAECLLEELGVAHCRDTFPWRMSAGERQRVSIARAVVHGPAVVFADEPTAALDRANAERVMECLRRAARGGALFVVTHDEAILRGASRILRMEAGRLV